VTTSDTATTPSPSEQLKKEHERDELLPWWLAAAIVGADIGTSVFYSTGVIRPYVGYLAPVVILVVCLLMWFFKATYEEGCSTSPFNGGAYMMVLQTVGRRMAMIVGSLTILSYLATAAISALSGAIYLDSIDKVLDWPVLNLVVGASMPVVFFGVLNLIGIKEPAKLVFIIAFFHFALLLFLDFVGLWMALATHADFGRVFQGVHEISSANFVHGFAAAFLGITGFESAAQIVEQLKLPTWRTLKKVYLTIVLLVGLTAPLTSYWCMTLLNDTQLKEWNDSLLSGLAYVEGNFLVDSIHKALPFLPIPQNFEGGQWLLYVLVWDACLILFAAVNTAYAGCIGLCTTMAKQGNLPGFFLLRWADRWPLFQGYPYVIMMFMAVSLFMIAVLPGQVGPLGEVYGIAFMGVMMSFCLGVVLLRLRMPLKVARSPYRTRWVVHIGRLAMPLPAAISLAALGTAEVILIASAHDARELGITIFLLILMVMAFYRMGVLEGRLTELPDLRLGLGRFAAGEELPEDLPTYVLCTGGAKARNLATMLIKFLEKEEPGPKEVIIFHAEEEEARRGIVFELLQRVVSQQVAPTFKEHDLILTVKVLPETLVDGLIQLKKARAFKKVIIGTGSDPKQASAYARELETNLGVHVVNIGRATA
jgi:amino acid transporter